MLSERFQRYWTLADPVSAENVSSNGRLKMNSGPPSGIARVGSGSGSGWVAGKRLRTVPW